jgi:hypothetical protein
MTQPTPVAMVNTKVVAIAIPIADETLFETPMNEHNPKNRDSTTLLTSPLASMISSRSRIPFASCKPRCKGKCESYAKNCGLHHSDALPRNGAIKSDKTVL